MLSRQLSFVRSDEDSRDLGGGGGGGDASLLALKHVACRGGVMAGTEVTDPLDFFKAIQQPEKFDEVQAFFDKCNKVEQAAIVKIFDGDNIFANRQSFGMWLMENEDEEHIMADAMDDLKTAFANVERRMRKKPKKKQDPAQEEMMSSQMAKKP